MCCVFFFVSTQLPGKTPLDKKAMNDEQEERVLGGGKYFLDFSPRSLDMVDMVPIQILLEFSPRFLGKMDPI